MAAYRIQHFNEYSLLINFPALNLQEAHRRVILLDEYCTVQFGHLLSDHIPAYESLLLVCRTLEDVPFLQDGLKQFFNQMAIPAYRKPTEVISIPVCYDPRLGNDLEQMAALHAMDTETLVTLHQQVEYHVYMLGFLPGFAYMGEVDESIATPRKPLPVPTKAGAVGIAGRQTGIYPLNSPGGWNIVGYTPLIMFDLDRASPSLLKPGNMVKFLPINLESYYSILKQSHGNH